MSFGNGDVTKLNIVYTLRKILPSRNLHDVSRRPVKAVKMKDKARERRPARMRRAVTSDLTPLCFVPLA